MYKKQHLTPKGFKAIISYYSSINKGMSSSVSNALPEIKAAERTKFNLPDTLNPYWVSGFTAGDGGFSVGNRPETGQIYFRFHVAQHSRDRVLMELLVSFFNCGRVNKRSNKNRCDFYVQDFTHIYELIIPHFETYPIYSKKSLDLLSFKKAADLFKSEGRTQIEEIKKIISNMNSKRESD